MHILSNQYHRDYRILDLLISYNSADEVLYYACKEVNIELVKHLISRYGKYLTSEMIKHAIDLASDPVNLEIVEALTLALQKHINYFKSISLNESIV